MISVKDSELAVDNYNEQYVIYGINKSDFMARLKEKEEGK